MVPVHGVVPTLLLPLTGVSCGSQLDSPGCLLGGRGERDVQVTSDKGGCGDHTVAVLEEEEEEEEEEELMRRTH